MNTSRRQNKHLNAAMQVLVETHISSFIITIGTTKISYFFNVSYQQGDTTLKNFLRSKQKYILIHFMIL